LERYLLRYFTAVIDQGNFSRAAASCNVSQPTLSAGIAKLERTIGQALFFRSNQRVELTEAGARLQVHARRIEREFNLALHSFSLSHTLPLLRLGVLSSVPGAIVAAALRRSAPGSQHRFELMFGSERELASNLAKGRLDVALTVVSRGTTRFLEQPVCTEGYSLAMAADHPLAGQIEVHAEQLAGEVMIVRRHCEALSETSRFFTERGVRPHFALRTVNDERALQMISAGLGITVMPDCYRVDGVARPKLAGFNLTRTLKWVAGTDAEPMLLEAPRLMTEIAHELRKGSDVEDFAARSSSGTSTMGWSE
jgi:DNA-binding transcriptional LysR family regulator